MDISTSQWRAKLYTWCTDVWDQFAETETDIDTTNRCRCIWTICVKMPLAIVANLCFWLFVIYAFLYYPVTRLGVIVTAIFYSSIVLFCLVIYLLDETKKMRKALVCDIQASKQRAVTTKVARTPDFFERIRCSLVALKRKVCPSITFVTDSTEEEV